MQVLTPRQAAKALCTAFPAIPNMLGAAFRIRQAQSRAQHPQMMRASSMALPALTTRPTLVGELPLASDEGTFLSRPTFGMPCRSQQIGGCRPDPVPMETGQRLLFRSGSWGGPRASNASLPPNLPKRGEFAVGTGHTGQANPHAAAPKPLAPQSASRELADLEALSELQSAAPARRILKTKRSGSSTRTPSAEKSKALLPPRNGDGFPSEGRPSNAAKLRTRSSLPAGFAGEGPTSPLLQRHGSTMLLPEQVRVPSKSPSPSPPKVKPAVAAPASQGCPARAEGHVPHVLGELSMWQSDVLCSPFGGVSGRSDLEIDTGGANGWPLSGPTSPGVENRKQSQISAPCGPFDAFANNAMTGVHHAIGRLEDLHARNLTGSYACGKPVMGTGAPSGPSWHTSLWNWSSDYSVSDDVFPMESRCL